MKFPTLYKRTSNGAIQQWTIISNKDGSYHAEEGLVGGKLTTSAPHTCEAKNTGKKNATTAAEQAEKEAKADWDKKLKRGYCEEIGGIDDVTFRKPMKGYKWKEQAKNVIFPVGVQNKLNGIRYQSEIGRSYSTGGETFHTTPHIRDELGQIFIDYPEAFLDGEAFNLALKRNLNRLIHVVSVAYKPKDLTPELLAESKAIVRLHLFDGYGFRGITPETPYDDRLAAVAKLVAEYKPKFIEVEKQWKVPNLKKLLADLEANRLDGGEGLMVRWGDCPRKEGKSRYMLKLKHFEDDEFIIVDIQEGNADWKGCAKRIVLKLNEPATNETKDETFAANIEGDREWLRELFERKDEFIGQPATTEYQQMSEYGIPQLPWVRAIRNYE
jgi:hypothetical protein